MNAFVVTCAFNTNQTLVDCAFKKDADANAYTAGLNGDKAKAVVRCKELIALRDTETMVKFLDEKGIIKFDVLAVEMK